MTAALTDLGHERHRRHVAGRQLLTEITTNLIHVDTLLKKVALDQTPAAVIQYLKGASADLDDARSLLEATLG